MIVQVRDGIIKVAGNWSRQYETEDDQTKRRLSCQANAKFTSMQRSMVLDTGPHGTISRRAGSLGSSPLGLIERLPVIEVLHSAVRSGRVPLLHHRPVLTRGGVFAT